MSDLDEKIKEELKEFAEPQYKKFQEGLLPGIDDIMGVRVPKLRAIAKKAIKDDWRSYLAKKSVLTYEERMIHGMIIGYAQMDIEERTACLDQFVPMIDNWAVCDCCTSTFKFIKSDQEVWFDYLMKQLAVGTEFSIRFAVVALMNYYVSEKWIDQVLEIYDTINHEGYYAKMAVAWGISICYVKFPEKTKKLLIKNNLDDFTHNKAIQKIRESYKVSATEKEALKLLKR